MTYICDAVPGIDKNDAELLELSSLLSLLPIHTNRPDEARFRNPNGVHMKLANFVRFDPAREGAGLSGGNKLEADVWETYGKDPTQLHEVVNAIKGHTHEKGVWHQPVEDEGEAGANEGKLLYRALRAANSSFKVANSGRTSSAPELAQPSCKAIIPADMNKKSLSITPSLYRTGKR